MSRSAHLRLLALAALVWAGFWVAGLPDYYQQYSFAAQLALSLLLVPLVVVIGFRVIRRARAERRARLGLWLSVYFTLPFAMLDYLYCGLLLGHGWAFLGRYWYLTVYYVIPWLIFLPIGVRLARPRPAAGMAAGP